MNKSTEMLQFNIAKPESARWLAILLAELQGYGVRFEVNQDANIVYVNIQ